MGETYRTSVSVPADLRRRMNLVKVRVNWSEVACRAFELKIAELITERGVKNMKDVVARLRASKIENEDARTMEGREDGAKWAKELASFQELEKLEAIEERAFLEFTDPVGSAYCGGECFYFALHPAEHWDRDEARKFWNHVHDDDDKRDEIMSSSDYLRGFRDGALETWDQVKDQL
jgi:hypothetical protein